MVLSSPRVAMLRAAIMAAELTREGEYRRGYVVWAVDEQGHEIARCQSSPQRETTPGYRRPSSLAHQGKIDTQLGLYMRRPNEPPTLTARECEVLKWISMGKSAWEIGEILGIGKRTVDEHAQTAARKLGAANRTQAVAIAVRDGLVDF